MSHFLEVCKQDTPRLAVMYKQEDGKDLFQWGVVGSIPIISLVGSIVRTQSELMFRAGQECDQLAFVIVYDVDTHKFEWFVHPDVPVDPLLGMLELVKTTLVSTHMARQQAAQQVLLGPDGRPMRA